MGNLLRDRRTPSELAASGQVIEFTEELGEFARLAGIIEDDLATLEPDKLPPDWRSRLIEGRLSFEFADAQDRCPAVRGRVAATVDVVCQRCLEPLQLPLAADLRLLFSDDQPKGVDEQGFEIWELEEGRLRPLDLVEEALIMSMPFAAMHEDDAVCRIPEVTVEASGAKTRPFAVLKSQMARDK